MEDPSSHNMEGGEPPRRQLTAEEQKALNSMSSISSGEGEGGPDDDSVWSKDIEDAFEDALAIYPPCGRRKIILSDEGKMYGRNELIARYIKMRTGKTRSRKQVSSHIQVLARRKQRELSIKLKHCDESIRKTAMENLATMSSAQIVSATMGIGAQGGSGNVRPSQQQQQPQPQQQQQGPSNPPSLARIAPMEPAMKHEEPERGRPPYWDQRQGPPPQQQGYGNHAGGPGQGPGPGGYGGGMHPPNMPPPQHYQGGPPPGYGNSGPAPYPVERKMSSHMGPPPQHMSMMRPRAPFHLLNFDASVEYAWGQDVGQRYHKSMVRLSNESFLDPGMERVDIRQIYDQFPGLHELYSRGSRNAFYLVKFWADLDYMLPPQAREQYVMSGRFESPEMMNVQLSSRVCSFGKQVVERNQLLDCERVPGYNQWGSMESMSAFSYQFIRSPLCDYMCSFIQKLKQLDDIDMMNSVLENFSVLQVFTDTETQSTLLCVAYVFEISPPDRGAQHHVYQLVDE